MQRIQDKLRPDGPLGSYADFTYLLCYIFGRDRWREHGSKRGVNSTGGGEKEGARRGGITKAVGTVRNRKHFAT